MLAAARQRTELLLNAGAEHVCAQLSSNQRENVLQAALAAELATVLPTHTEFPCPVLYTTQDGRQIVLATERPIKTTCHH